MDRNELIISLCQEAGDDVSDEEEVVDMFEINHSACCVELLESAAAGDVAALIKIRTCCGLPIFS